MNGYLSALCPEHKSGDADDIAEIPCLEFREIFLAYLVYLNIDLHSVASVSDIYEVCLAHIAPAHDPSRESYVLVFELLEIGSYASGAVGDIEFSDDIRVFSLRLELVELFDPYSVLFGKIFEQLFLCHFLCSCFVCHKYYSFAVLYGF